MMPSEELTYLETKQLEGNSSENVVVVFVRTDGTQKQAKGQRKL